MRNSWGGLVMGVLALAVLEGVVSRSQASANVGGFLSGIGGAVKRFVDPTVPLFSVTATTTATTMASTSTSSSAAVTTTPAGPPTPAPAFGVSSGTPSNVPILL